MMRPATWRNEGVFREEALRLAALGVLAAMVVWLVGVPAVYLPNAFILGPGDGVALFLWAWPALFAAFHAMVGLLRRQRLVLVVAWGAAGIVAQLGWSRWLVVIASGVPMEAVLAGGGTGLILALGLLPRHLGFAQGTRSSQRGRGLAIRLANLGEPHMADLLSRAVRCAESLRGKSEGAISSTECERVEQALALMCDEAEHWMSAAAAVRPGEDVEGPAERWQQIAAHRDRATDPGERRTWQSALDEIDAQRASLESLVRGRRRTLAEMHRLAEAIERLALARLGDRHVVSAGAALASATDDVVALAEDREARRQVSEDVGDRERR
jgi:hypothetical protein